MSGVLFAQDLLDVTSWPPWVISLIGVAAVLTVILVGSAFVGRKKPPAPLPPPRPQPEQKKKDQRSALRRGGNPIDVLISDAEAKAAPSSGLVIDRSLTGMCLSVDRAYEVGDILSVRRSNPTTPWVRLEVKNCRLVSGSYEIGCVFVTAPPASVLMMFG